MIESFKSLDAGDNNCTALTPNTNLEQVSTAAQATNYTFDLLLFNCPALIMSPLSREFFCFATDRPSLRKNNTGRGL